MDPTRVQQLSIQDVPVPSASIRIVDIASDLGVVINSGLTMSDHVTAVCRSTYYQLRQLRMIVRSLSDDAKKTLVQSFVSCRLDCWTTSLAVKSTATVSTECCCTARHWCFPSPDMIISLRCWDSATGCLWNRDRWRCLFISHCIVLLHRTCRMSRSVRWSHVFYSLISCVL